MLTSERASAAAETLRHLAACREASCWSSQFHSEWVGRLAGVLTRLSTSLMRSVSPGSNCCMLPGHESDAHLQTQSSNANQKITNSLFCCSAELVADRKRCCQHEHQQSAGWLMPCNVTASTASVEIGVMSVCSRSWSQGQWVEAL